LVSQGNKFPDTLTKEDVESALDKTAGRLEYFQHEMKVDGYPALAAIFEAHIQMVKDKRYREDIMTEIDKGTNSALAILKVGKAYRDKFLDSGSSYLINRGWDICDFTTLIWIAC